MESQGSVRARHETEYRPRRFRRAQRGPRAFDGALVGLVRLRAPAIRLSSEPASRRRHEEHRREPEPPAPSVLPDEWRHAVRR